MTKGEDLDETQRRLLAAKRLLKIKEAKDDLLSFIELCKYDPADPDNPDASIYEPTPQAKLLCEIVEQVRAGKLKRVAVSISPQTGKSEVLSRFAPAWLSGNDPYQSMILASYNETLATQFGSDVRNIIQSRQFQNVFPEYALTTDTAAKDFMKNIKGGRLAFVGTGGSATGMRADNFFIDDPIKDNEQAQSETFRDKLWDWFNSVAGTRCHGESAIIIVHTRWHEDDLIGRLCDPDHPERDKKYAGIADNWMYLNIPAVVSDRKLADSLGLKLEIQTDPKVVEQFGEKPVSSLWPSRFPLSFLAEMKKMDPRVFGALRMGKPTPEDGDYFRADWIVEYDRKDLPDDLRLYGASDHAVSAKQAADQTVMGCVGLDEHDELWILPDILMMRGETDQIIEEMIKQMRVRPYHGKPMLWWLEDELISKSFGPFLRKRMREENVHVPLIGQRPAKDKMLRARSIQGLMAMKKVHLPRFAPWYSEARNQLLKFPYATRDDFVDFISLIGAGLDKELVAPKVKKDDNVVHLSSIQSMLRSAKARADHGKRQKATSGW